MGVPKQEIKQQPCRWVVKPAKEENMNKAKRVMSYFGHVIWYTGFSYCFANGDGTDNHYLTIEEAMKAIEKLKE